MPRNMVQHATSKYSKMTGKGVCHGLQCCFIIAEIHVYLCCTLAVSRVSNTLSKPVENSKTVPLLKGPLKSCVSPCQVT